MIDLNKYRHPRWIDLNPHAGDSWFGLTRKQAKKFAYIFIGIGLFLALPPGLGFPGDDFVNLFLAKILANYFPIFPAKTWLILTFSVIGPLLILIGLWIFPFHTESLINGYMNKAKFAVKRFFRKPENVLMFAFVLFITFKLYSFYL